MQKLKFSKSKQPKKFKIIDENTSLSECTLNDLEFLISSVVKRELNVTSFWDVLGDIIWFIDFLLVAYLAFIS